MHLRVCLQADLRRAKKAADARAQLIAASITLVKRTKDIDEAMYDNFCAWMRTQAAGAAALERGSTYDQLHVQSVVKVYATTPQKANRLIKVSGNDSEHSWLCTSCKPARSAMH